MALELKADDPIFTLTEDLLGHCVDLKANIADRTALPHRGSADIDCGVDVKVPAGFRLRVESYPPLANRGLIVVTSKTDDGRVRASVLNVGREIVEIKRGDVIAQMSVEPAYQMGFSHV